MPALAEPRELRGVRLHLPRVERVPRVHAEHRRGDDAGAAHVVGPREAIAKRIETLLDRGVTRVSERGAHERGSRRLRLRGARGAEHSAVVGRDGEPFECVVEIRLRARRIDSRGRGTGGRSGGLVRGGEVDLLAAPVRDRVHPGRVDRAPEVLPNIVPLPMTTGPSKRHASAVVEHDQLPRAPNKGEARRRDTHARTHAGGSSQATPSTRPSMSQLRPHATLLVCNLLRCASLI